MQVSISRLKNAPVTIKNITLNSLNNLKRRAGIGKLKQYAKSYNKPNAIFIWIPKNAGSSTYHHLSAHHCPKLKSLEKVIDYFPNTGIVTFGHMDVAKLASEHHISKDFYDNSFKFAFSRNPYSRAVSLYSYLKRKAWLPDISFLNFSRRLVETRIPDIGLYNQIDLSHCNPQVRWLEHIEIDHIGKVEHYSDDLRKVFSCLNLPAPSSAVNKNPSKHSSVQSLYCEESKQIIEHYYQKDFNLLGYSIGLVEAQKYE